MARSLASSTPQACEDMDLEILKPYPKKIYNTAESITKDCREFIDSEKVNFRKEMIGDILNEQEYFEKKAMDIQTAGSEMKSTLKRFMFLSPRGVETRTVRANTDSIRRETKACSLLTDEEKLVMRQRINQESPI